MRDFQTNAHAYCMTHSILLFERILDKFNQWKFSFVQGLAGGLPGVFEVNAQPADVKGIKLEEGGSILGPAIKVEPKAEVKLEEKKAVDGPVSKWTMVDYDDDSSAFPGDMWEAFLLGIQWKFACLYQLSLQPDADLLLADFVLWNYFVRVRKTRIKNAVYPWHALPLLLCALVAGNREAKDDDIFPDLEKTPVVESGRAPAPDESSPEPDVLAISRDPADPPEPVAESRGGGERMDAADEGRRARLRQVFHLQFLHQYLPLPLYPPTAHPCPLLQTAMLTGREYSIVFVLGNNLYKF